MKERNNNSISTYLIKSFFEFEWKVQKLIVNINKKYSKKLNILLCAFSLIIFFYIIACSFLKKVKPIIIIGLFILFIAYLILICLTKSLSTLTTLTGFMFNALVSTIIISLFIACLYINYLITKITNNGKFILEIYICIILIFSIVWLIFSTLCNNKVSIIANTIFSLILNIIVLLNTFYWNLFNIYNKKFLPDFLKIISEKLGYTDTEFAILTTNIIIFPIFIMFVIGTIGCYVKQYWIEKYNDGRDI